MYKKLRDNIFKLKQIKNIPITHADIYIYLFLLNEVEKENSFSFSTSSRKLSKLTQVSDKTIRNFLTKFHDAKIIKVSFVSKKTNIEFIPNNLNQVPTSLPQKRKIKHKPTENKHVNNPPTNKNIPEIDEFLQYVQNLELYKKSNNKTQLDELIKAKYETWKSDNWHTGYNKPIRNWKSSITSTLPYLLSANSQVKQEHKIPTIQKPVKTYNE